MERTRRRRQPIRPAGAQLKNTTPEEADKLITDAIRGYFDDQRTEKQDDNK